jgi:hypothetical protein
MEVRYSLGSLAFFSCFHVLAEDGGDGGLVAAVRATLEDHVPYTSKRADGRLSIPERI